ncbi:hypothetical protein [Pseudarthrobacter sp. NS4]|uniref:hypothetical protein n=1 Tax=Pseudarthrobacter sp. NS4 TaxID=2973976 RepID=UPI002161FEA3|nr:hypothetical protein [Pseudarthrobacter sp. NS4]
MTSAPPAKGHSLVLDTTRIFAGIIVAAVALIEAVLGGTAGMRNHRKVDRAGFTPRNEDDED